MSLTWHRSVSIIFFVSFFCGCAAVIAVSEVWFLSTKRYSDCSLPLAGLWLDFLLTCCDCVIYCRRDRWLSCWLDPFKSAFLTGTKKYFSAPWLLQTWFVCGLGGEQSSTLWKEDLLLHLHPCQHPAIRCRCSTTCHQAKSSRGYLANCWLELKRLALRRGDLQQAAAHCCPNCLLNRLSGPLESCRGKVSILIARPAAPSSAEYGYSTVSALNRNVRWNIMDTQSSRPQTSSL